MLPPALLLITSDGPLRISSSNFQQDAFDTVYSPHDAIWNFHAARYVISMVGPGNKHHSKRKMMPLLHAQVRAMYRHSDGIELDEYIYTELLRWVSSPSLRQISSLRCCTVSCSIIFLTILPSKIKFYVRTACMLFPDSLLRQQYYGACPFRLQQGLCHIEH